METKVVKNRLSLAGLDPFVLELHSNKANKKREILKLIGFSNFLAKYVNEIKTASIQDTWNASQ